MSTKMERFDEIKKQAEVLGAFLTLVAAAAYSFTLGYLDQIRVPESPAFFEAVRFYVRAVLNSRNYWWSVAYQLFFPFLIAWIFVSLLAPASRICGRIKWLRELIVIVFAFLIMTGCGRLAYSFGFSSLAGTRASEHFPPGIPNKDARGEMRLLWIGEQGFYWLDCDPYQSQIEGYKDGKTFFVRTLDSSFASRFCSDLPR